MHLPTLVLLGTSKSIELLDDHNYTTLGIENFILQPELRNYGPQCDLGGTGVSAFINASFGNIVVLPCSLLSGFGCLLDLIGIELMSQGREFKENFVKTWADMFRKHCAAC